MDWKNRLAWFSNSSLGAFSRRDIRLRRFRQVLLAALRTRGYRQSLQRAGFGKPEAIAALCSIDEALHRLPCLDWAEFKRSPADYSNPFPPDPAPPTLRQARKIKTAVLSPRFVETDSIRIFDPHSIDRIRSYAPEAIAAPIGVLRRLADMACRAGGTILTLSHSVVVFTGPENGILSDGDRDLLWRVFEVPIFEQWLGGDGALMGWECEAHEGLHTVPENAIFEAGSGSGLIVTSLTDRHHPAIRLTSFPQAIIEDQPCECGQPGSRLIGLPAHESERTTCVVASVSGD